MALSTESPGGPSNPSIATASIAEATANAIAKCAARIPLTAMVVLLLKTATERTAMLIRWLSRLGAPPMEPSPSTWQRRRMFNASAKHAAQNVVISGRDQIITGTFTQRTAHFGTFPDRNVFLCNPLHLPLPHRSQRSPDAS